MKSVVLALLSVAACISAEQTPSLKSWIQAGTLVDSAGLAKVDYNLDFDMWWGTQYNSGLVDNQPNFSFEKVSLVATSLAVAELTVELFGAYKFKLTPKFELINWRPLEAQLTWYRPEAGNLAADFDVNLRLTSFLNLFSFLTDFQEQGKVTMGSFAEMLKGTGSYSAFNNFGYNAKQSESYADSFYQFAFVDYYFPDFAASRYYGQQDYISFWLLGKQTF